VTTVPAATTPASAENSASPQPAIVQTPSSGAVGTVTGRLTRHNSQTKNLEPIAGAPIYLGTILKTTDGREGLVELTKETAPKAVTDPQGHFIFTDVPSGRYGLMLDAPFGTLLLNKPENGGDLIVEVAGGKALDLGELTYDGLNF